MKCLGTEEPIGARDRNRAHFACSYQSLVTVNFGFNTGQIGGVSGFASFPAKLRMDFACWLGAP